MFQSTQARLKSLLSGFGNESCADCGSRDPKWVSLNFGVLLCIKCSGVHRGLGVHISKVSSVKLDEWTDEQLDTLIGKGGNTTVNSKYEASIPENCRKPKPDSSTEERADFIRRKYELQEFLNAHVQTPCPNPSVRNIQQSSSSSNTVSAPDRKLNEKQMSTNRIQAFRNSWRRRKEIESKATKKLDSTAGRVEFIGLIKVNVVRGTNLAVRDVLSSDPYVILSLGNQSMKTRVIKNNLNPVWNEQLVLSIPEHVPPLKLLVYDKDTFSSDDFMGEAEIDIQPLVAAAKAAESTPTNEPFHPGKWLSSKEDTLVQESAISCVDGRVKQEIAIKLKNVERGVLEIELECVPLTQ